MLFQNFYIIVINYIYKYISRIDKRIKNTILFIGCLMVVLSNLLYCTENPNIPLLSKRETTILLFLLIVILTSINHKIKPVSFKLSISIPYYISAFGILFFGFINSCQKMYILLALEMIFVFPCYYLIACNNDDNSFFINMSHACCIVTILYYLYCFKLAFDGKCFFENNRLIASASNANKLSFFVICAFVSSLYLLQIEKNNKIIKIFSLLSLGVSITMTLMTSCKSSFIAIVLCLLFYIPAIYKSLYIETVKNKLIYIGKLLFLCSIITIGIYQTSHLLIKIQEEHSSSTDQEKINTTNVIERFDISTQDTSNSSYVRIIIWKTYCNKMNLTGHNQNYLKNDDFYPLESVCEPHNNYISISYYFGIITGMFYTFWIFTAGLTLLRNLLSKRIIPISYIFTIMISIVFAIISMVDICVTPYTTNIVLMFYLSLYSIMFDKD